MQKPSNHMCFTVFFTHATFSNRLLTCKQKFVKMVNFLCQNWAKIVTKSRSEASQTWNHVLAPFLTRIFNFGSYFWPHFGTQNRFQSIQNGLARLQRFQECPRCLEKQVMMPQKCLKGPFNWSPKPLTTSSDTAFRLHCANALTLATVSNLTQRSHCSSAEFVWCEWTERIGFAIADEQSNEIKTCSFQVTIHNTGIHSSRNS